MTICIGSDEETLPFEDAVALAEELRRYAAGFRGSIDDPAAALELAEAIDGHLARPSAEAIHIDDRAGLDALHTVLNAIVHEPGPAMKLYTAVAAARQQDD